METNALKNKFFLVVLFTFCSFSLFAQTPPDPTPVPIWSENFNAEETVETVESFGWSTTSTVIDDNLSAAWVWKTNGSADDGQYWNQRPPIKSEAPVPPFAINGAMVFDANFFTDTSINISQTDYLLSSPTITETGQVGGKLYLKFNQFYRAYDGTTEIIVKGANVPTDTFQVNQGLMPNYQTSSDNVQVLDISAFAGDTGISISFSFSSGSYYFWIIDDIALLTENPKQTYPNWLGDNLLLWGYPYELDSLDGAYVPNQYVVKYLPGTTEAEKQLEREYYNVPNHKSCMCKEEIELWYYDDETPSSLQLGSDINEIIVVRSDSSKIEEIDKNHYNYNGEYASDSDKQDENLDLIRLSTGNEIKVVIMDTGVDYTHPKLQPHIWKVANSDCETIDGNPYNGPIIGWDFVGDEPSYKCDSEDPYPMDKHSHGTHVAGIVVNNLTNCACPYKLIPLRTHDEHGTSTLFDVACAFYYSMEKHVDIINASFGYYGELDPILQKAVEEASAQGIEIFTSSGNEGANLDTLFAYPAKFELANLFTVGALNFAETDTISISNTSTTYVDFYAVGDSVLSTVPGNEEDKKTGTSMAAPKLAAAAVQAKCTCPDDAVNISLVDCKSEVKSVFPKVDFDCLQTKSCRKKPKTWWEELIGWAWPYLSAIIVLLGAIFYGMRNRIKK